MRSLIPACLLVILLGLPAQIMAASGHIEIKNFKVTALAKRQYRINAQLAFQLSEKQREALQHGVKLNASIDLALGKHRSWWWNSLKLVARIPYELKYHALSKHYVLKRQDTGKQRSFTSLPAALREMGKVENYALPPLQEDIEDGEHYLYIAAKVDVESRSLPLKVQSYFKRSKYYTESEGVIWALP